ncbi:hypothetical protein LEMLEM_LOCUS8102 [Lemmus lemmus]
MPAVLNPHYRINTLEPPGLFWSLEKTLWQRSQESPLERAGLRLSYSGWFRPICTPSLLRTQVVLRLV